MPTVNYPVALPGPAWFVISHGYDLIGTAMDDVKRVCASENQAQRWLARSGLADAEVIRVDVVWSAHCVTCADKPDLPPPGLYRSWDELREYLRSEPGWVCTSEQHVFCPNHRPDKED
ncbi:hypothetical protein ACIRSS_46440 [Amycolatopsis sp. NPDC101161]|uniref:hypothetical protein n=1 Tax=Amycolatopsis sp. NPDC101161 TaxID=3363940 RepID=UPI0037F48664